MKNFFLLLILLPLMISSVPNRTVYQVIVAHPHQLDELKPFIETVRKDGRLWLVHLKPTAPWYIRSYVREAKGNEDSYLYQADLKKRDVSQTIVDALSHMTAAGLKSDVEKLSSFKTRKVGTVENKNALEWIKTQFQEMGFENQTICFATDKCSVVAEQKGDGSTDEVILIMGHFDSVGHDFAGADDNASGTATMLEMARSLKSYDNKRTIRYFATNGEESGLQGATHYAKLLKASGEIKKIALAINMDMTGYNSNGLLELETNPEFDNLAKWFAQLAADYTTLKTKITLNAWGSDHVPFLDEAVPTLLTIENWDTKTPCYHQACDKPDTLNYQYALDIGKLNVAAVMTKDGVQ